MTEPPARPTSLAWSDEIGLPLAMGLESDDDEGLPPSVRRHIDLQHARALQRRADRAELERAAANRATLHSAFAATVPNQLRTLLFG